MRTYLGQAIIGNAGQHRDGSTHKCGLSSCQEPVAKGEVFIGVVPISKNGKRFTILCHLQCFVEFAIDRRAREAGKKEENRASGKINKGGHPKLPIDNATRKMRQTLQFYCYRDQKELTVAILLRDPIRITNSARKLSLRLVELANPEATGGNVSTRLRLDLLKALTTVGCISKDWENARDPTKISALLVKNFCKENSDG